MKNRSTKNDFNCLLVYNLLKTLLIQKTVVNRYKLFVLAGLLVAFKNNVQAQQETDYAIHANIIYHFTKYINWPDEKKSGDFIIGITGDTPLYNKLETFVASKTVGQQRILIKKFSSSASSFNCHILFIDRDESSRFKKIVSTTAGASILLVTESEGLARKGACINFAIVNERLKLEINKNTIEHRNLGIATELLNLGIVVK